MSFFNLYNHNFARAAVAIPEVRVADPAFNASQTVALISQAADAGAVLVVLPELGLSAYSCEDLFHQQALLDAAASALGNVLEATRHLPIIAVVGVPLQVDSLLYNCAAVISRGRLVGVAPKTYLPTYREFYELRQFTPGDYATRETIDLCGQRDVPFGTRLLFQVEEQRLLTFFVEICEDLWTPVPPSSLAALAGATVLINLSASNVTVGKDEYRRQLVSNQSARCIGAYLYCAAGYGESTTDLAWDGHGMIYENGSRVAETERFSLPIALGHRRRRSRSHRAGSNAHQQLRPGVAPIPGRVRDSFAPCAFRCRCQRVSRCCCAATYERFPYVPADPAMRDERCREILRDPGPGTGQAAASHACRQSGDRHLRRTGFHARAHRLRPCHGRDGVAARRTFSATRCPGSRPASARWTRRAG